MLSKEFDCTMSKEEFEKQKEFEDNLMNSFFARPPLEVQLSGKRAILDHIVDTAIKLYEGPDNVRQ